MKIPSLFPLRTLLSLVCLPVALHGQADDFNDGDDNGWSRNDPLGELGAGPFASFTVIDGQYRISADTSPDPGAAGPARAASFRQDRIYSDFCVGVDIIGGPGGSEPVIGLLARIQPNPSLGTTDGYALTLQRDDNDIQISRVVDEVATNLSTATPLFPVFDPARSYRLLFLGNGDYLEGAIYDLADLTTPLAITSTLDAFFPSGILGLVVFDNTSAGDSTASAVFDNYQADDGTPPPLEILLSDDNEVSLRWPGSALCHVLEQSFSLENDTWTPVTSGLFQVNGSLRYFVGVPEAPEGFFRLAFRGPP